MVRHRFSSKYLLLSLVVALVPLISFSVLYNSYFVQLVSQLSDEQLATRLAATQNEIQVFLRERRYELDALADQFEDPELFEIDGRGLLSSEVEDLLRLQTDPRSVYGIAFFDADGQLTWTFPQGIIAKDNEGYSAFEGVDISDPSPHSWEQPSWLLMKKKVEFHGIGNQAPTIGLIIRFSSITEILSGLNQAGAYKPILSVGNNQHYDVVGQPVELSESSYQQPLLSHWALHLVQNQGLVTSPLEQMRFWLIILVICTIAGLLLLHISISRRLGKQVDTIVSSVERVALGDLETPIGQTNSAEMSRLTDAIESMRHQLKAFITSTLEIERRASLGQLAAGVAHDIRNPLTTIRTTIVALVKREKDQDNRDMLVMLEGEIDRVNDVIENLLNFARPRDPHGERIFLQASLDSLKSLVNASAREQGISISIDCSDTLFVWADPVHLRQVLMNLVLNSIQAMGVKGDLLQIRCAQAQNHVELLLSDNGPGIPEDVLPHIAEPFFTTKSVGTGLGLAICHVLVKKNQGELHFESQSGHGTQVTLKLPFAEKENLDA